MIPTIAAGFLLLGALLLWFVIGSRGAWPLKLAAIVVTTAFAFGAWDALDSFDGWPTANAPPDDAVLVSSLVDEPRAIYVWVTEPPRRGPLAYHADGTEPRAYRLPYTRGLHEELERARRLSEKGEPVELRRVHGTSGEGSGRRYVVRRYQLPATALPRKNQERPSP